MIGLTTEDIAKKAASKQGGVAVQDRKWRFHIQKQCFVGKDMVKWLKNNQIASDEFQAEKLGQQLLDEKHFTHIEGLDKFMNAAEFYRF